MVVINHRVCLVRDFPQSVFRFTALGRRSPVGLPELRSGGVDRASSRFAAAMFPLNHAFKSCHWDVFLEGVMRLVRGLWCQWKQFFRSSKVSVLLLTLLCGSHHLYDSAFCSNFASRGEKVQSFERCSMATVEDEAISDLLREGCQTLLNAWFERDGHEQIRETFASVVESGKLKASLPHVVDTGVCYTGFRQGGKLPQKGHLHPTQLNIQTAGACLA